MSPATLRASVVVPTTGDRGPLLPLSVGSALAQTVDEIEVLVVGDGVDDATRAVIEQLVERDRRVRFFDFPKHERRGEPNRHRVLTTEARGAIVAYLCDRDLLLPDHIAELERALRRSDFAHTLRFRVAEGDELRFMHRRDLRSEGVRSRPDKGGLLCPLSFVGHTMDAYRRLPHGWRTTPTEVPHTDRYMWEQFLSQPWVRVAASPEPTVLTFVRGGHPGLSTAARLEILQRWTQRLGSPGAVAELKEHIRDELWKDWSALKLENLLLRKEVEALRSQAPPDTVVTAGDGATRRTRGRGSPLRMLRDIIRS